MKDGVCVPMPVVDAKLPFTQKKKKKKKKFVIIDNVHYGRSFRLRDRCLRYMD